MSAPSYRHEAFSSRRVWEANETGTVTVTEYEEQAEAVGDTINLQEAMHRRYFQ